MRRARGCLFGLLGVILALAVVGEGVDIAARHYATSRMVQRIKVDVPTAQGVHGRIRSFPFLKVGVDGHIDEMGATIDRIAPFTDIDVDIRNIVVATSALTSGQVTVKRIGGGTVTAIVPLAALSPLLGGHSVVGATFTVLPTRVIAVKLAGLPVVNVPLPTADVLPCLPTITQKSDELALACSFTHVPAALTTVATSS